MTFSKIKSGIIKDFGKGENICLRFLQLVAAASYFDADVSVASYFDADVSAFFARYMQKKFAIPWRMLYLISRRIDII